MSSSSDTVSRLPQEIWDVIIVLNTDCAKSLKACTLTCQAWRDISCLALYNMQQEPKVEDLLGWMALDTRRGAMMRTLIIYGDQKIDDGRSIYTGTQYVSLA